MKVIECKSEQQKLSAFNIIKQLRPHLDRQQYLSLFDKVQKESGRLIAAIDDNHQCLGCAVFRNKTTLFSGTVIYIDDLVVDDNFRSKGIGKLLISWVEQEAIRLGITLCILDSGVQRHLAHKFYFRHGYQIMAYHFQKSLT